MLQSVSTRSHQRVLPVQRQDQRSTPIERQEDLRIQIREWLMDIMRRHDVSQRQVGLRAGVSPSTINRALAEDGDFVMTTSVIAKIAATFGERVPGAQTAAAPRLGFAESDVVMLPMTPGQELQPDTVPVRWKVTSRALNLEGCLPGDIIDFDMSLKPERGDIVIAQVYDNKRGSAETVMRVFHPPYLIARSTDMSIDPKPLYVDNDNVLIVGVMRRLSRDRAL